MVEWDRNYFQKDEDKLEELGYKQQLLRNLTPLHNFGISFSIISVPVSVTVFFEYGLLTGGPQTMVVSWIVVSFFSFCVALSMAEIVSALPTCGGPYFWAAMLAPSRHSAVASWITAWFNLIGLTAAAAGVAYGGSQLISTAVVAKTGYLQTPGRDIGICAGILVSWAFVNTIGRSLLRYLLYISVALNSLGLAAFIVVILIKAPSFQPASFVFKMFIDNTGNDESVGWSIRASPAYVACIGGIMGVTSFMGYDASAHIAEETIRAAWIAPLGIVTAVGVSTISGLALIIALLFSIQNLDTTIASSHGQPVFQILIDSFGVDGALALFTLPIICTWYCGLYLTTAASRMLWAFSRDKGMPKFFSKIDEKSLSPIRAVVLCSTIAFFFLLPSLGSSVVLNVVSSISVIGLLISYLIPITLHLVYYRKFCSQRGPFYLGRASRPMAVVSMAWIGFSCIVLCLPNSTPVTTQTLNYGPIAVVATIVCSVGLWMLHFKKSFVGPAVGRSIPIDIGHLVTELKD